MSMEFRSELPSETDGKNAKTRCRGNRVPLVIGISGTGIPYAENLKNEGAAISA
jgi:hypothetical protein